MQPSIARTRSAVIRTCGSANASTTADAAKPKAKEEVTRSGIVLPDTASEKPQEGTVLSVGPGRLLDNGKRVDMEVKEGDSVLFAKYAGTEVKIEGEELLVVRESDLLAVVNGQK